MHMDVKLGVAISLAVVLVAGTYFFYRDTGDGPIPLADQAKVADRANGRSALDARTGSRQTNRAPKEKVGLRTRPGAKRVAPEGGSKVALLPRSGAGRNGALRPKAASAKNSPTKRASPVPTAGRRLASAKGADGADSLQSQGRPLGPARRDARKLSAQPSLPVTGVPIVAARGKDSKPLSGARRTTTPQPRKVGTNQPAVARDAMPSTVDRTSSSSPRHVAVDMHHVQSGDTLASIASNYYGSERYTRFLIAGNPQIPDPNHLRVGMKVKIPPRPTGEQLLAASKPRVASETTPISGKARTYRVQEGDSFYAIARDELGDAGRWKELLALNDNLVHGDPKQLRAGQIVTLPVP